MKIIQMKHIQIYESFLNEKEFSTSQREKAAKSGHALPDGSFPIENTGVVEYPLMNEVVVVGKYMNKYFYSKKLNKFICI